MRSASAASSGAWTGGEVGVPGVGGTGWVPGGWYTGYMALDGKTLGILAGPVQECPWRHSWTLRSTAWHPPVPQGELGLDLADLTEIV